MKSRLVAAVALSLALAPACRMQEQKANPNLNKAPAPIVETIRDAGVRMTDEGKDKLKGLVPVKEQPEQKAAEKADAGVAKENANVPEADVVKKAASEHAKRKKEENPYGIDWSKVKLGPPPPRGRSPEEIEKAEKAKSTQ